MKNPFSVIARYFNFKSPLTYIGCLGTLFLFSIPFAILISIGGCVAKWEANQKIKRQEDFDILKYSCTSSLPDEIKINEKYYLKKSFATEYSLKASKEQTLILQHYKMFRPLSDAEYCVYASSDGKIIKKGDGEFGLWNKAEYINDYLNPVIISLDKQLYNLDGSSVETRKVSNFEENYSIKYNDNINNRINLCDESGNPFEEIPAFEKYELISDKLLFIYRDDFSGYVNLENEKPKFTQLDIKQTTYHVLNKNILEIETDSESYILNFLDGSPVYYKLDIQPDINIIYYCSDDIYLSANKKTADFLIFEDEKLKKYPLENLNIDCSIKAFDRIVSISHCPQKNNPSITTIYTLEEY